jgi:predicted nucleotidyltransferase
VDEVIIFKGPAPIDVDEMRHRLVPLLKQRGAVKAVLFGSYARGSADAWSDVDLVVVMPTEKAFVERPFDLKEILDALPAAVDLLVYTPEEFEADMRRGRNVFDALAREGVIIL